MGYSTHFHGKLEFTRPMRRNELVWIDQVTQAGLHWTDEARAAIWEKAAAEREARGGGPTIISGPEASELAAGMTGFITGEGLSAGYASDLRISNDARGFVYCSEKTYDMVAGVNFIIVNTRTKIPDFGLKGMLAADTEFEPYLWFVKIGKDGMAYGEKTTKEEFFAFRRKLYPNGYAGDGLIDPADKNRCFKYSPTVGTPQRELMAEVRPGGGIQFVAYHEDAERQIQDSVFVPATIKEARELGEWLCKVARNLEPDHKTNPIRQIWNRIRGIDP